MRGGEPPQVLWGELLRNGLAEVGSSLEQESVGRIEVRRVPLDHNTPSADVRVARIEGLSPRADVDQSTPINSPQGFPPQLDGDFKMAVVE